MPRRHKNPPAALAASPAMIAAMLNIRPDDLADAIAKKQVHVFQRGVRRRILVEEAVRWLKSWPEAKYKGVSHDAVA